MWNSGDYNELDELRGDIPAPDPTNPLGYVQSLNGLTGAVVIANASVVDGEIVVDTSGADVHVGNSLFVDVDGSDVTGTREDFNLPFATPAAARAAALAGDTVFMRPGNYTCSGSLVKPGVNWEGQGTGSITFASDSSTEGIWDDLGVAAQCNVNAPGWTFIRSDTSGPQDLEICVISCAHSSSVISVICDKIRMTAGGNITESFGVLGEAGTLYVEANEIVSTAGGSQAEYAVWWTNGQMNVVARLISSEYGAVGCDVDTTATGEGNVTAQTINGVIVSGGTDTGAAFWVRANTIHPPLLTTSIISAGNNRLYVETQKLFGAIESRAGSGLVYVRADKISAVANGGSSLAALVHCVGGTVRAVITELDPVTFIGQMIKQTGGTLELIGGRYVGISGSDGLEITGGTALLRNVILNTAASNTDNPITKSGGTLKLYGCTLVADATRDSIEAATAQNVMALNTWANTNKDANVTITTLGGFNVDSDVS